MTAKAIIIGDALIDEIRDDTGVREFVGGAALNVAVGLQRLGATASLVAMVGDDHDGEHVRSFLTSFGVNLIESPAPRGTARAVSERVNGEPHYVFNEAARKRMIAFSQGAESSAAEADVIAASCVALDNEQQSEALMRFLDSNEVPFALDANPRAGMLSDRDAFVWALEELLPRASVVKVGDDDAKLLYGKSLDEVVARWTEQTDAAIVATAGSKGASVTSREGRIDAPIAKAPGPIVDTMGAGDATFSSLVFAFANGQITSFGDWEKALNNAMFIAALTCRNEGALLQTMRNPLRESFEWIST